MKMRKKLDYETINEIGMTLIKQDTDFLFESSDKAKAESAIRISGIIDFLHELEEATVMTDEEIKNIKNTITYHISDSDIHPTISGDTSPFIAY